MWVFLGGLFKGFAGFDGPQVPLGLMPFPARLAYVRVSSSCSGLSSDSSWDRSSAPCLAILSREWVRFSMSSLFWDRAVLLLMILEWRVFNLAVVSVWNLSVSDEIYSLVASRDLILCSMLLILSSESLHFVVALIAAKCASLAIFRASVALSLA